MTKELASEFRGVYYVPESDELVVLHKVEIKPAVNLDTGNLSEEIFVTIESASIEKIANVVISKDNLRKLVHVGEF